MSVFKNTFSRALQVIPSNDCDIPFPNLIVEGLILVTNDDQFTEAGIVDFTQYNIKQGDIVYFTDSQIAASVISVDSDKKITVNINISSVSGNFVIYQASSQTGLGNPGCYLYVPSEQAINVVTIGGDFVTFSNIKGFLPVQIIRLTGATNGCIALW